MKKLLSKFTYDNLHKFQKELNSLTQILALNPNSAKIISAGAGVGVALSNKSVYVNNSETFKNSETARNMLTRLLFDENKENKIKEMVAEKFSDEPKASNGKDSNGFVIHLNSAYQLNDIMSFNENIATDPQEQNKADIKITADLGENIKNLEKL